MTHSEHSGGCCHAAPVHNQQSLDGKELTSNPLIPNSKIWAELDFERGIWAAARDGEEERVRELLGKGTHPSQKDSSGYTALHYAARAGHMDVVQVEQSRLTTNKHKSSHSCC